MLRSYPLYPSVSATLREVRSATFRGNAFGQVDAYYSPSDEDREVAERFDVAKALKEALAECKVAGLDTPSHA